MKEKNYITPNADIIVLNTSDIVTASGGLSANEGDGRAMAEIGFSEFGF